MPRDVLDFYNRNQRPWPTPRMATASIIGHTTSTTTRLWLRLWTAGEFYLVVSRKPLGPGDPSLAPAGPPAAPAAAAPAARQLLLGGLPVAADVDARVLPPQSFTNATDRTGVFDVDGLLPDTEYYYRVFSLDPTLPRSWQLGDDEECSFRTLPLSPTTLTFGLFSCHMPFVGDDIRRTGMWEALDRELRDRRGSFVIGAGDQVYADGYDRADVWKFLKSVRNPVAQLTPAQRLDVMLSWYRDVYRGYWGLPALQRLFARVPTYMIWDDHEIRDGWGSFTDDEELEFVRRFFGFGSDAHLDRALVHTMFAAAARAYSEYEHARNPGGAVVDTAPLLADFDHKRTFQWDYSFDAPPASFFVMDVRGHKKFDPLGSDVLGGPQLQRLLQFIASAAASSARALFIVSPVPLLHHHEALVAGPLGRHGGAKDDLRDEWDHPSNRAQRDLILDGAFAASHATNKPIVFLSGDVHMSAAFEFTAAGRGNARICQLTSSGISYSGAARVPVPSGSLISRHLVPREGFVRGTRAEDADAIRFRLLQAPEGRNNFALVTLDAAATKARIHWDLYAPVDGNDSPAIVHHARLTL